MSLCQAVIIRVCLCVSGSTIVSNEIVKLLKMRKSYINLSTLWSKKAFLKPSIVLFMHVVNSEFNSGDQQQPIATKRKKKKKEKKPTYLLKLLYTKKIKSNGEGNPGHIPDMQIITGTTSRITNQGRLAYITESSLVVPQLSFLLDLSPNR